MSIEEAIEELEKFKRFLLNHPKKDKKTDRLILAIDVVVTEAKP